MSISALRPGSCGDIITTGHVYRRSQRSCNLHIVVQGTQEESIVLLHATSSNCRFVCLKDQVFGPFLQFRIITQDNI